MSWAGLTGRAQRFEVETVEHVRDLPLDIGINCRQGSRPGIWASTWR